ncbi:universal stress protein [Niabella yanshanensis]|uniref:Universal stress protein n=1 Tax=Niabella yanshanensis TaxID=577386 RepID=A0ABZ0W4D5_9BACT|nr:universal stress protein [Niabella yanshanensis]WQD38061.1 universal stress protein [Niabella yanshanensis]
MKSIVAALDLQGQTDLVVNKAIDMADKFGADLHLVHVVAAVGSYVATNMVDPLGAMETAILPNEVDLIETYKNIAEEQLEKIKKNLSSRPVITKVLLGTVEDEVVNYAREIGAELIVIGTHQHSGLSRLLNGETSVRILHEAQIPILVIPTIENK